MKTKSKIFLVGFLASIVFFTVALSEDKIPAVKENKKSLEQEDTVQKFKETLFLQLDSITFPNELKRIEGELRQNVIDVILTSNTHSPVFAKKRVEGYSTSYTKFFGLKVTITPMASESDYYAIKFFYYNWTTNKYDKELVKKISKFNVLNDMRFALFELLNGKDYVKKNYDKLQKENYERIQDLRKIEEENASGQKKVRKVKQPNEKEEEVEEESEAVKKKNKLLRKEREKERNPEYNFAPSKEDSETSSSANSPIEEEEADEENRKTNKTKTNQEIGYDIKTQNNIQKKNGLRERKDKKDKTEQATKSANNRVDKVAEEGFSLKDLDILPDWDTPKKSSGYALATFFNEYNKSEGLLGVSTNLRYFGLAGRYYLEEISDKPRGYRFALKIGLPLFKDKYEFPVYRSIETEAYRKKILKHFVLFGGVDYSPVHNVNLPAVGENLQVFENDFVWLKAGLGYEGIFMNKNYNFRFEFLKSIFMSSNQNVNLSGTRFGITGHLQVVKMLGLEMSLAKANIGGDLSIKAETIQVSVTYLFEN